MMRYVTTPFFASVALSTSSSDLISSTRPEAFSGFQDALAFVRSQALKCTRPDQSPSPIAPTTLIRIDQRLRRRCPDAA